ncbi:antibiotic biosynthesis monooxygenase [Streptomyces sp. enrichment culture]|uniref:antibiotic biosynthesis monooxygenase n=1 Tax=Streptomyces sp. enrichment culture TaxID=1795815 RepID=UPI003F578A56
MDRPDADIMLVSRRFVGDRERQRAAVESVMAHWSKLPLPVEFLSLSCFESIDGEHVMTISQWSDESVFDEFSKDHPPLPIPGVETQADAGRLRPQVFHRYRSHISQGAEEAVCVVTPVFDVDGPERQRQAVDALLDGPLGEPFPGLKAMHFHLSTDGVHVLNYAEWTSTDAHRAFLESEPADQAFAALQGLGGVRGLGGKAYVLHHRLTGPSPEAF